MASYVRAANPIWSFVDLTGNQLDDSYYIFYLENTAPYLPQIVYQDDQALVPWSDPIQFLANGTLPENIFFDESLVYRMEIRQGNTQSDPLIYVVNNFIPGQGTATSTETGTEDNQISNPQFSQINFVSPLSIATAGTYNIAPGWDLVLTGSGAASVTQIVFTGSQDLEGARTPPYAIEINTNGWSSAILRQRFSGNGAIWANSFVSMAIQARSNNSIASPITLQYAPNSPVSPITITSSVLSTGPFSIIQGVIPVPEIDNEVLNNEAYVDMNILLPGTGDVQISNVQVMGQVELLPTDFALTPEETIGRQIDHLFHLYSDSLITQPKKSLLSGWNFPLNPYQFIDSTLTLKTSQTQYIADQTILHQATASTLLTGKAAIGFNNGLGIESTSSGTQPDNRFCIIQYIDPATVLPYWSNILSVMVNASLFSVNSTNVRLKVRLIYRTTLPSTIGNVEPIASWPTNSDPVFSTGWTAIVPQNDPAYVLEPAGGGLLPQKLSYDKFQLPVCTTSTQVLGIVVYTMDSLDSTSSPTDQVLFDKISLVPNNFAVESEPQTFDQVLNECQYYYEKSADTNVQPLTGSLNGSLLAIQYAVPNGSGGLDAFYRSFGFQFKTNKRAAPSVTLYSPFNGTINYVYLSIRQGGNAIPTTSLNTDATLFIKSAIGKGGISFVANAPDDVAIATDAGSAPTGTKEAFIQYHYIADSRLGV